MDKSRKRAVEVQNEIDRIHLSVGRSPLLLAPLYREMRDERRWEALGYHDFDDWIDNYSQRRWRHGRTRVYQIISTHEKLSRSFDAAEMSLMLYENAFDIAVAFGESVPERFKTVELVRAASELPNEEFRSLFEKLAGDWHLPEKPKPKTFDLTSHQSDTVKQAISKVKRDKKEEGVRTDAQALEYMAHNVIMEQVCEAPLDPILALLRKIEAVNVDCGINGREHPTAHQWGEIAGMSDALLESLLAAEAKTA